jgi:hypothetical protein
MSPRRIRYVGIRGCRWYKMDPSPETRNDNSWDRTGDRINAIRGLYQPVHGGGGQYMAAYAQMIPVTSSGK